MKQRIPALAVLPLLVCGMAFSTPSGTHRAEEESRAPGVVMVTRSTVLQSGQSWNDTISVQGGDLLVEFADASGRTGSLVHLAGSQELILNDDRERSYIRVDRELLENFAANTSGAMAQMEQALAAMPEAQREMVMQAAGGRMPGMGEMSPSRPVAEIRETGETGTKNGYAATRYDLVVGDRLTQQLWVAEWTSVEHGVELRGAFESLTSLWASFQETMGDSPFGGASRKIVGTMEKGVPVLTTEFDEDGNPMIETVLQAVAEADVDRSAFGPEEGYREQRVEMPRMPGR